MLFSVSLYGLLLYLVVLGRPEAFSPEWAQRLSVPFAGIAALIADFFLMPVLVLPFQPVGPPRSPGCEGRPGEATRAAVDSAALPIP